MVKFEDNKFTIEVETSSPIEDFLNMKSAIINMIQNSNADLFDHQDLYWAMELIAESEISLEQLKAS